MTMTMMIVTGSRDPVSWVTPLAEFPSPLSDCSFEDLFMPLCKMQNKIQKQPKEIRSSVFLLRYLRSLRGTFDAKCNLRPIKQSVKLSFEYTGSLCMRRHIARTAGNCSNNNKKKKTNLKAHKIAKIKSRICIQGSVKSRGVPFNSVLAAPSRWQRIQRIVRAGFAGIDAWHTDTDWS